MTTRKKSLFFSFSMYKICCYTFIHGFCLKISQYTSQPHVNKRWALSLVQLKDFLQFLQWQSARNSRKLAIHQTIQLKGRNKQSVDKLLKSVLFFAIILA